MCPSSWSIPLIRALILARRTGVRGLVTSAIMDMEGDLIARQSIANWIDALSLPAREIKLKHGELRIVDEAVGDHHAALANCGKRPSNLRATDLWRRAACR